MEIKDTYSLFGLSQEQTKILFIIESYLTLKDIESSKKEVSEKKSWHLEWCKLIQRTNTIDEADFVLPFDEIVKIIQKEFSKKENKTWIYLIMLEATIFRAYVPLGQSDDADKVFKKLKFESQKEILQDMVKCSGTMDPEYIERFEKTYKKAINQISGKMNKIAIASLTIVAVSAVAAATAGMAAGPIAVALFGNSFAGLHGAALTAACLAMAGGGAISIGGAGIAGGVAAIVGGGALLGAAGGGAAVTTASVLCKTAPSFTLTQAAKLEVVLKEILLNAQQDIDNAQAVMNKLKEQIHKLQTELDELKMERERDKETYKNLEKSLGFLRKAYKDMNKFKSAYETGVNES